MKKNLLIAVLFSFGSVANAQTTNVGVNTATPKTTLDITGTATATEADGVLVPRLTVTALAAKDAAYGSAQNGALVFITGGTGSSGLTANITGPGFYYYNHPTTKWIAVAGAAAGSANIVDLDVTLSTAKTLAVGSAAAAPEDIVFNNLLTSPSLNGASYSTTTGIYTVGVAGYYSINVNILSTNTVIGSPIPLLMVGSSGMIYGSGYSNTFLPAGTLGRGILSAVVKLAVNDQVKIQCSNASATALPLSNTTATRWTVTKL